MFGLFRKEKDNSGWFSWNGINGGVSGSEGSFSCGIPDDPDVYFRKEPERDYFQDLIDLEWSEGYSDFDPLKPLF